jgi:hypothetical protein
LRLKIFEGRKKEIKREIPALIDFLNAENVNNEHGVEGVGVCFIPLGNGN